MSVEVTTAVWSVGFLTPTEKLVLLRIADYCDARWQCWVGQSRLSAETGFHRVTVNRTLARLEERGLIHRSARYGGEHFGRYSDITTIDKIALLSLPAAVYVPERTPVRTWRTRVRYAMPAEHAIPSAVSSLRSAEWSFGSAPLPEPLENPKEPSGLDSGVLHKVQTGS
jgi:hypothetical protein